MSVNKNKKRILEPVKEYSFTEVDTLVLLFKDFPGSVMLFTNVTWHT